MLAEIMSRWESAEERVELLARILIIYGFVTLLIQAIMKAPYGRYASSGYGFGINAKLAWFIQESPSFFTPWILLFISKRSHVPFGNKILLLMFTSHYFQRSFIYPYLMKKSKDSPFFIVLSALGFCLFNGYLQGFYLVEEAVYHVTDLICLRFIFGLALFIAGISINIHSDHLLRRLRVPGDTGYRIPRGGAFDYVSAGNYFGEIVEWWGFALASGSLPAVAFALFTSCFLIPRGVQHHKFYLEKFEDYPRNRNAVIPYII
ncbi:unnamed protein product [Darwinula stevensoni]|uniref:3-oxo-5alpha-steroid 4-dehydrogenase (NADP(+)) n=1 Tax=Darwinula stevensoni TaxID=69355 RepID=A0A7R8X5Y7_9CRUS|nr:unnamed protein product [Darwinula stevensoni]CAG0880649.1 unnamed protein product [Darwinula stevensoni]